ncbi:putative transcription factor C3H family [Helianthus annuus]|nr:putative transcription factor C3H family [Helianthus annuus]
MICRRRCLLSGAIFPPYIDHEIMLVCKHFLEAVEKKQYGWFWVCPNGNKECHYRHALPPGYILKSQMKALLEEEANKLAIEDEIEDQVSIISSRVIVLFFLFI